MWGGVAFHLHALLGPIHNNVLEVLFIAHFETLHSLYCNKKLQDVQNQSKWQFNLYI
jgi:hypothetical protein